MEDSRPDHPLASEPLDARTRELASRLFAVEDRITSAVERAGRIDRPTLIVVTKFFPASDVVRLLQLGVTDLGENRDQEASAKAAEVSRLLRQLPGLVEPRWHFVGQLQSKKARSVITYAHVVHSVDRPSLLDSLRRCAAARAEASAADHPTAPLDCLVQVDLRSEIPADARGGAVPGEVPALAAGIAEADGLRLAGLMAVAPVHEEADVSFARLAGLSADLQLDHPGADMISAGMSNDLEEAVAAGATHLRVGRDVLGKRPAGR